MKHEFNIPPLTVDESKQVKGGFSTLGNNPPPGAEIKNYNCRQVLRTGGSGITIENWNCSCPECFTIIKPVDPYE